MAEEEFEKLGLDNYKLFIDKITVLYGETKTGKSTILINILHTLQSHIEQIIVFAPTDPQNKTYSKGVVPLPLIHYTITLQLLQDIWDRQQMMAAVRQRANDLKVLKRLFDKLDLPNVRAKIAIAEQARATHIESIKQQYIDPDVIETKCTEISEKFNNLMVVIYKNFISKNEKQLRQGANEDELFVLDNLGFNHRMVIVFDDCTSMLKDKEIKNSRVFNDFFTCGRWAGLTILFGVHNDKILIPEIRTGAFVSIFTSKRCATAYFMTGTNYFDSETKAEAKRAIKQMQEPENGHDRVAYLRENNKFYICRASLFPKFSFTENNIIERYCAKIKDQGSVSVDKGNKFYSTFFNAKK